MSARLDVQTTSPTCIAVVVTFNRKDMLAHTLQAIRSQSSPPGHIVIIDNASTDGTHEMLLMHGWTQSSDVTCIMLEVNTGGAGGFHRGIREAFDLGASWIWVMDDDCTPKADCLARLLSAGRDLGNAGIAPGLLASKVEWTDGTPCLMNAPAFARDTGRDTGDYPRIVSSSFVSMLIGRHSVEAVGLPVSEFFIWFDDVEYSLRISSKMPCHFVPDSVAVHQTATNPSPLDFRLIDAASVWKYRYGVRNEMSYRFHHDGCFSAFAFCAKVLYRLFRTGKLWGFGLAMLTALRQGVAFDYRAFIRRPADSVDSTIPA